MLRRDFLDLFSKGPGNFLPPITLVTCHNEGYRTKRVGFVVTFRLFGAEKSVLKLVGANLKDGQNVLVLWRLFGLLVRENPH